MQTVWFLTRLSTRQDDVKNHDKVCYKHAFSPCWTIVGHLSIFQEKMQMLRGGARQFMQKLHGGA